LVKRSYFVEHNSNQGGFHDEEVYRPVDGFGT
jgi:hypothetical protein